MRLAELRDELVELHRLLPANNLVAWTSGNVSARDPDTGLVAIKASGVAYDDLTAERMVVVDINGTVVDGADKPSSDTASHLYVYRNRPDVGGVVHTHSRYATAFATHGRPVPCITTAMADEFGGDIPCGGFALIGGDEIGKIVVETLAGLKTRGCLLRSHGVFTIGDSARAALKTAVMVEDNAAIAWAALALGTPLTIARDDVASLHARYLQDYGQ